MLKRYKAILKKVILVLEDHYRNVHSMIGNDDIKCSNCNEWFSVTNIRYHHSISESDDNGVFQCECGQCNAVSYWKYFGNSKDDQPVLVDPDGKII
jgi:hypothetical protein